MHKMGLIARTKKQLIDRGEHSETIFSFFYYPQSDRATVQIKQINNDELINITLEDTEIRNLIATYKELKFEREIQK